MNDALLALWFFVPAGLGNMAPVLAAKAPGLRRWNALLDNGRTFRGKRVFGDHKTWRGLIIGIVVATLTFWVQKMLVADIQWLATLTASIDYDQLPVLLLGPLFGLGALGGDAIESFFKRQINVAPGRSWFPFDQLDYIIGGAVATFAFVQLTLFQYIWLIVIWLLLHIVANYIGYFLRIQSKPF